MPQTHLEKDIAPASLHFDLTNPRAAGKIFSSEQEVLKYLVENSDVNELVSSILATGWIDFEPLIVETGTDIVLEGNRRLAALRLISRPDLREQLGYNLPAIDDPQPVPTTIRVFEVAGRTEARAFIAFKHINGPAKWDAMAKARYAEEWYSESQNLAKVSKAIGDTHNTVLRLINGWRVYQHALVLGFELNDMTARRFNFSHLYTALSRPAIRPFLGLSEDVSVALPRNPVQSPEHLLSLMKWIYGKASANSPHLVRSQNPDLGRLVRVIGNERALAHLVATGDLKASSEIVEPASQRFAESLSQTAVVAERALGLVSHFDATGQEGLVATIRAIVNTVRLIRDEMVNKAAGDDL